MAKYNAKFPGMYDGAQQYSSLETQLDKIERDLMEVVNRFYAPEAQLNTIFNQLKTQRQNTSDIKSRVKALATAMKNITETYERAEKNAVNSMDQAAISKITDGIAGLIEKLQIAAVALGMNPANLFSADPVNLATGNYVYENTFLNIPYDMPLSFRLFYNVLGEKGGTAGNGWRHNFELSIQEHSNGLYEVFFDDGSVKRFIVNENGLIEPLPGTTAKLTKTVDGYKYNDIDWMHYYFTTEGHLISQRDRVGNYFELTYDKNNRLERVQNDQGDYICYSYNKDGKLESVVDNNGRAVTLKYDADLMIAVCDVMGNETAYNYDDRKCLIEITNPNGICCLVNRYDDKSRTTEQFFPDGGMVTYEYKDSENQLTLTEQNGNSITYEHDDQLRNIRNVYSDGQEVFEYNSNNQRTAYVDKMTRRSEYTYDWQGNLTGIKNALGETLNIGYTDDCQPNLIILNGKSLYKSEHNQQGKEISMTDALGRKHTFNYDEIGNVIEIVLPDGSATSLSYDKKGNVCLVTKPGGGQLEYIYDELHRVICSIDENGNKTEFTYNPKNDIVSVTNAEGNVCNYEYDYCGNVTKITDFGGRVMEIEYNSINKPCRIVNQSGGVTLIEYDQMWNASKVTDPDGGVTSYVYNQSNKLESVSMPDGATTYLRYDACGNLIERIRPDGAVYRISYDALNRPVEVINPDGDSAQATFTSLSDVSSITLSDGRRRIFEHDIMGQMTSETSFGGHKKNYEYNELGLVTRIYDDCGDLIIYEYHPGGMLKTMRKADGSYQNYSYDLAGNLISAVNQDGNTWSFAYDSLSRLVSIKNSLGSEEHCRYDAVGNITEIIDGKGAVTQYRYSLSGKLTTVIDALGNETSCTYDAMDRLTSISQFEGLKTAEQVNSKNSQQNKVHSTNLHRDLLGNIKKVIDGAGNITEYTYDHQRNITSLLDADGYLTEYEYCADGRTKNIFFADGRSIKMSYNSLKQLNEIEDWLGITHIQSDAEGRPLQVTNHNNETVRYDWSVRGELLGLDYPDGSVIKYQYDEASRMLKATGPYGSVEYDYHTNGLIKGKQQIGVYSSEYQYDAGGRLTSLLHKASDGTMYDRFLYSYDENGRKSAINKQRQGMSDSDLFGFEYDLVGNLINISKNGVAQQTFSYDAFGNRKEHQSDSSKLSYSYDALNRLVGITGTDSQRSFNYDKRGNLVEEFRDGTLHTSLLFDASNRLAQSVSANGKALYTYNGLGGRVGRLVMDISGTIVDEAFYCLDIMRNYNDLLQQRNGEGVSSFYYDDALLWGSGVSCAGSFLLDELKSPIRMISRDGDVESYSYDTFGGFLQSQEQSEPLFGFTGYRYDNISGLYFAQRREYAPDLGRFISHDPVYGNLAYPKSLNRYTYCLNDPINYVDYTGLFLHIVVGGAIGAVASVGGRFIGDVGKTIVTGKPSFSSWQEYTGSAVGGFAGGATFAATGNPVLAGAVGGGVGALATGGLQMISGSPDAPKGFGELLFNTALGAGVGAGVALLPGVSGLFGVDNSSLSKNFIDKVLKDQFKELLPKIAIDAFAENILSGAFSEPIKMAEDWLRDGFFGALGLTVSSPSPLMFPLLSVYLKMKATCPLGA